MPNLVLTAPQIRAHEWPNLWASCYLIHSIIKFIMNFHHYELENCLLNHHLWGHMSFTSRGPFIGRYGAFNRFTSLSIATPRLITFIWSLPLEMGMRRQQRNSSWSWHSFSTKLTWRLWASKCENVIMNHDHISIQVQGGTKDGL